MEAELSPEQIGAYATQFPGPLATWAVASVAAGNTAGRLWGLGPAADLTLLLWDQGNNVLYLGGAVPGRAARDDLERLVMGTIRPAALARGRARFKVRALSQGLEEIIPTLLPGVPLHETASTVYLHGGEGPPAPPAPAIAGFRLAPIDRPLLEQAGLERREEVLEEIGWMWPEPERFYSAGFGVAACVPGALIGWCTAEYVSPGRCGVGIATAAPFQGQGVASAIAARFVQECRARGVTPLWETAAANGASRRVAEKAGFTLVAEERAWIGSFEAA